MYVCYGLHPLDEARLDALAVRQGVLVCVYIYIYIDR